VKFSCELLHAHKKLIISNSTNSITVGHLSYTLMSWSDKTIDLGSSNKPINYSSTFSVTVGV